MKKILLIVLPLLLIVGCSKPVEDSTLIKKDGLMYLPDSDKPYTGEVFINYSTGEKLYQGTYENGLLIDYSYLNEDGSVKEPINYETTLIDRDGVFYTKDTNKPYSGPVFSLNDKGLNKRESILEDGKMITYTDIKWYDNGQKRLEGPWKDGKPDGLFTIWYENGQKWNEETWKDGKKDGLWTEWFENEKVGEKNYKDDKLDGLSTEWYENGQKAREQSYKDGKKEGLDITWYENGMKKKEENYKTGKKNGLFIKYNRNGLKTSEKEYVNGKPVVCLFNNDDIQVMINSLIEGIEIFVMDQVINHSMKSYPDNPFDVLKSPECYVKSDEPKKNGNWWFSNDTIYYGFEDKWFYDSDSGTIGKL